MYRPIFLVAILLYLVLMIAGCNSVINTPSPSASTTVTPVSAATDGMPTSSTPGPSVSDIVEHHYVFKGESEHWTGEYAVDYRGEFYYKDGTLCYDSNTDTKGSVTYKSELSDLASVKKIIVSYETPSGNGSITTVYDKPPGEKTFNFGGGSDNGSLLFTSEDVITITITVDGKTETMELKAES